MSFALSSGTQTYLGFKAAILVFGEKLLRSFYRRDHGRLILPPITNANEVE